MCDVDGQSVRLPRFPVHAECSWSKCSLLVLVRAKSRALQVSRGQVQHIVAYDMAPNPAVDLVEWAWRLGGRLYGGAQEVGDVLSLSLRFGMRAFLSAVANRRRGRDAANAEQPRGDATTSMRSGGVTVLLRFPLRSGT